MSGYGVTSYWGSGQCQLTDDSRVQHVVVRNVDRVLGMAIERWTPAGEGWLEVVAGWAWATRVGEHQLRVMIFDDEDGLLSAELSERQLYGCDGLVARGEVLEDAWWESVEGWEAAARYGCQVGRLLDRISGVVDHAGIGRKWLALRANARPGYDLHALVHPGSGKFGQPTSYGSMLRRPGQASVHVEECEGCPRMILCDVSNWAAERLGVDLRRVAYMDALDAARDAGDQR